MTETEPKVEAQQATKDDLLAAGDNVDTKAPADGGDAGAQNASSPSKTGTLKSAGISVHKKDYENNVVYLYQFVRSATVPSLSACCLKVENWLRINGIQYENIDHKLRFKSKKGQLPFVELNGKEIEDSDVIIRELAKTFDKDLDSGLTPEQKTVSHAFESMLNNHTGWIVRWWRYNHAQDFLDSAQLDIKRTFNSRFPNSILNLVFKFGFRKHLRDSVGNGVGKFTDEEVLESAKSDLKALSSYLAGNDYFFGKEPHLLDNVAFAHLSQFIYVPFGGLKEWIETETPNLLALVERIKQKYWSDWDVLTASLDLNTHIPKSEAAIEAEEAAKKEADAKKEEAEKKKAEKKKLAEEKKKEREEKKKKEKEEKERKKKEKEEADKAAKEKAAAEEAAKKAEADAKKEEAATEAAAAAPAEEKKDGEPEKTATDTPNGGEAAKPAEVTASE